jgi:hypothetical protein
MSHEIALNIKADGVTIEELERYVAYAKREHPNSRLREITVYENGDVDLGYEYQPFSRIRRITGYLVGDMDRWNDAKRSEEHDRVKHGMAGIE